MEQKKLLTYEEKIKLIVDLCSHDIDKFDSMLNTLLREYKNLKNSLNSEELGFMKSGTAIHNLVYEMEMLTKSIKRLFSPSCDKFGSGLTSWRIHQEYMRTLEKKNKSNEN